MLDEAFEKLRRHYEAGREPGPLRAGEPLHALATLKEWVGTDAARMRVVHDVARHLPEVVMKATIGTAPDDGRPPAGWTRCNGSDCGGRGMVP